MKARNIVFGGKEVRAVDLEKEYGVRADTLYSRYLNGYSDYEIINGRKKYKFTEEDGEELNRTEFAVKHNINPRTLQWRINNGWNIDDCTKKVKEHIDYNSFVGKKFGDATILSVKYIRTNQISHNKVFKAHCVCSVCGHEFDISLDYLRTQGDRYSHHKRNAGLRNYGFDTKRERVIWTGMIFRCNNPKSGSYKHYGGRGIKVCDEWMQSFDNFLKDMGRCPDGYSLDRINVNGNYEPSNCRWASTHTQANNKRTSHYYSYNNITMTGSEWARLLGVQSQRIRANAKRNNGIKHFIDTLRKNNPSINNLIENL